jgi:hypothetical protein
MRDRVACRDGRDRSRPQPAENAMLWAFCRPFGLAGQVSFQCQLCPCDVLRDGRD